MLGRGLLNQVERGVVFNESWPGGSGVGGRSWLRCGAQSKGSQLVLGLGVAQFLAQIVEHGVDRVARYVGREWYSVERERERESRPQPRYSRVAYNAQCSTSERGRYSVLHIAYSMHQMLFIPYLLRISILPTSKLLSFQPLPRPHSKARSAAADHSRRSGWGHGSNGLSPAS